jgi:hypothetical protein
MQRREEYPSLEALANRKLVKQGYPQGHCIVNFEGKTAFFALMNMLP